MWLAFDDTDSRSGGCTTHLMFEFVAGLEGVDVIGAPRLVRLNPGVPHKTRGNASVAVRLGHGAGKSVTIGRAGPRELRAFERGGVLTAREAEAAFQRAADHVQRLARLDDPAAQPAVVSATSPVGRSLYDAAVSRYVGRNEVPSLLGGARITERGWNGGRGVIGAASAISWPGEAGTFEAVAYRDPKRIGTPRRVSEGLGVELDKRFPSTFDNHDPIQGKLRVVPGTPCPVMAGVRGTRADQALAGAELASQAEGSVGCLVFWTNQATDDHLRPASIATVRPYTAPVLEGNVVGHPHVRPGGHSFVRVQDATGAMDVVAYEPTKQLRTAVRSLQPGDHVRCMGGVGEDPTLLALEKLELREAVARVQRRAPTCPTCKRRMASRGRGASYRCEGCGARAPAITVPGPALPEARSWEAAPCARRHLSRPLGLRELAARSPWNPKA